MLRADSQWLKLDANGRLRLSGRLPATANIDWQYLEVPDWPLAGRLEIGGDFDAFAIEHRLRAPVDIDSSGEISFADQQLLVDLENRWSDLALLQFGLESPRGVLNLRGSPAAFDASLSALASLAGVPETTINAEARMTPYSAESAFVEAANVWGKSEIRGTAGWQDSVRFDLEFGLDEIDVQVWAPQLSGELSSEGTARGEMSGADRIIELDVQKLEGLLNGYPVNGSALLRVNNKTLQFERLLATVGTNRIAGSGSLGETVDITASLNADTLAAFHPDLSGEAEATVNLDGPPDNPSIKLQLATSDVVWRETAIDQLTVAAVGTAQKHTVDIVTSAFSTDLELDVQGGLLDKAWRGDIRRLSVSNPAAGQWRLDAPAALAIENAAFSLQQFCLLRVGGDGKLCGNLSSGDSAVFNVSIEQLPVTLLPLRLPASIQAKGDIYASLDGELKASVLNANTTLEVRDATITSSFEDETIVTPFSTMRLDAQVNDNQFIGRSRIETQEGSLSLDATIGSVFDVASPLDGTATLNIPDLAQLGGLLPALANPVGKADGELRLAGSLEQTEITGAFELRDGAFGVRAAGVRIENIQARISQDKPASLALKASATSGEGTIELLGETSISDTNQLTTTLTLSGSRFELLKTPDIQALASPNVTVIVNEAETAITGELGIPRASVKLREIPASASRVSPDAVVHRSGDAEGLEQKRPINLDIKTVLGEQVSLSAFGLSTNLRGNLQLRGDANKTINGFGRVSLVEGRYKAYGQDLAIERGELIFNGPLGRPQLDVRAVRNAGDVVAGIQVRGTPEALQSEVFSQPPMRDIEALSYLLTGRPLNQENRDGDLLGDAAFALGLSGAGAIASRVRSNLGLDTLSIQGGSENGRIVAGKRLNDRLLVEYGYGIVDRLGTLLLRYQLNERLVLESRTGVVSNLDLVYRVRKK
jgi:translocation and assembly module TamB